MLELKCETFAATPGSEMGKTIIVVSSHILPELADVCNKIGIIDQGVMNFNAEASDLMRLVRRNTILRVRVTGDMDHAAKLIEEHEIVDSVERQNGELAVKLRENADDYSELPTLLVENGHKLSLFREEDQNLESAFMAFTKNMKKSPGDSE